MGPRGGVTRPSEIRTRNTGCPLAHILRNSIYVSGSAANDPRGKRTSLTLTVFKMKIFAKPGVPVHKSTR